VQKDTYEILLLADSTSTKLLGKPLLTTAAGDPLAASSVFLFLMGNGVANAPMFDGCRKNYEVGEGSTGG
jgi:hypothetical protein